LTTTCDEELKLSEACLLTAGIMVGEEWFGRRESEEEAKVETELAVGVVCNQSLLQVGVSNSGPANSSACEPQKLFVPIYDWTARPTCGYVLSKRPENEKHLCGITLSPVGIRQGILPSTSPYFYTVQLANLRLVCEQPAGFK
jgi:hypothetical protein